MNTVYLILLPLLAYLLGSIPTAVWVGKLFYDIDLRQAGSGNAGATNTIRVLGWKAGIPVLVIDMFKAWLAVHLPLLFPLELFGEVSVNFQILCGLLAVIGHVFPVFAGFRGGKGVASLTGIVIALFPETFLIVLVVFILLLVASGYVSVASIVSALIFPISAILVNETQYTSLLVFSIIVALLIPALHYKNIKRLLKGTESKFINRGKT